MDYIKVTEHQINVGEIIDWLSTSPQDGAIVTFIGKVRSFEKETVSLFLEHYAGMTEKVLTKIIAQARMRWSINKVVVIHRVGEIHANETIVFVGVSSAHRSDSFAATEFIMDLLKSEAPFWKKERTIDGDNWVTTKKSDIYALKKWF